MIPNPVLPPRKLNLESKSSGPQIGVERDLPDSDGPSSTIHGATTLAHSSGVGEWLAPSLPKQLCSISVFTVLGLKGIAAIPGGSS